MSSVMGQVKLMDHLMAMKCNEILVPEAHHPNLNHEANPNQGMNCRKQVCVKFMGDKEGSKNRFRMKDTAETRQRNEARGLEGRCESMLTP